MQLQSLLTRLNWKLLLLPIGAILLTGCSRTPETEVVLQTEYQKQNIPIQERPKKVVYPPVDWYVVTEENLEEFVQRINDDTGNSVFFAVTPKGYENLAIGIADLRRYIKDSQAIIGYYEEAITEEK